MEYGAPVAYSHHVAFWSTFRDMQIIYRPTEHTINWILFIQ